MRKKLFVMVIISIILLSLSSGVMAQEVVKWTSASPTADQEEILKNVFIDVFNQSQDDYKLEVRFDADYDRTIRADMLAGAGPDIVLTAGVGYAQEYIEEGYLLPLDEYAEKYGWYDRFLPIMIKLGSHEGHLYALPKTYESMVLFYNKTLFEEHGWEVPTNRAELDKLTQEITDAGIIPFAQGNAHWRGHNEQIVGVFLNHYAGLDNMYKALKGEKDWNDPVFVEAMELLDDYFQKDYFGKDYFSYGIDDSTFLLSTGQAAMRIVGTWGFQRAPEYFEQSGMEWDWAPLPSLNEGVEYPMYDLGIGATLSINANSEVPDGAAEVLEMLSGNKEVIGNLNRDWPGEWNMPVNTINAEELSDKVDPRYARHMEEVAQAVDQGNYGYTTWTFWPQNTQQYLIRGIEEVWNGELTPQKFMDEVNETFEEELSEGYEPMIPER